MLPLGGGGATVSQQRGGGRGVKTHLIAKARLLSLTAL